MPEIHKVNISLHSPNDQEKGQFFFLLCSTFQMISAVLGNSLLAACTWNANINFYKTINSKFQKSET